MSDTHCPADLPIYSAFIDDPDLAGIVKMFVDEMPLRVTALKWAAACKEWDTLEQLAHQMKGSAGSYGFPQATRVATNLGRAVRERQSTDAIHARVAEMTNLCVRMRSDRPKALQGDLR